MVKVNYKVIDKEETVRNMVDGNIDLSNIKNYYVIDFKNEEITCFDDSLFEGILRAVNNPEILFAIDIRE